MGKRQIYLLFSCDAWKTYDSERLVMATTSAKRLKKVISDFIKRGEFEYDDPEQTKKEQAKRFNSDWEKLLRCEINAKLSYALFDYVENGEVV